MTRRLITADDLLKIQLVGDPQFSPDGARAVFSRKTIEDKFKSKVNLWLLDLSTKESRQLTQGEGGSGGRWLPDGKSILFTSGREKPTGQFFQLSLNGGEAEMVSNLPEGSIGGFKISPDGQKVAFTFRETHPNWTEAAKKKREEEGRSTPPWEIDHLCYRMDGDGYFGGQRYKLYVLNLIDKSHFLLSDAAEIGAYIFDWMPDSESLVVSYSACERVMLDSPNDQMWRVTLSGESTPLHRSNQGSVDNLKVSPDGQQIAYLGCANPGGWGSKNIQLWTLPISGGDPVCLTESHDFCLDVLSLSDCNFGHTSDGGGSGLCSWTENGSGIYVSVGAKGEVQLAEVDVADHTLRFITQGHHCVIASCFSATHSIGTHGDPTHPFEIALFDLKSGEIALQTNFNHALIDQLDLAPAVEEWLTSPDGTPVHAWVMRPPQSQESDVTPGILTIHGGPHAQYGWAFFHEFQLMAAQGWTLVFSNPRGSKGYGEAFCDAIAGDWGNADWVDIQTVRDFMKSHPGIDSSKMGVMGGSYGGYMTNWVIGHTHDFRAAISDRCVSNWVSMAGNSDWVMNRDAYFGGECFGPLEKIAPLWRQSPLSAFDNVQTPTLIIHSEGDLRCNVEQSDQVFHALQARGIESRYVRYPVTTSHGLSRSGPPDLRLHRLGEMVRWWQKFLD